MKKPPKTMAIGASLFLAVIGFTGSHAVADCKVVDGGKLSAFDGKDLRGLMIEKKSLIELNNQFPNLNVIEMTFKGEVQTCTHCTEKHVTCSK